MAGRVPDALAAEGVQLQYAVDTRLDELLVHVFQAVTEAPLLNNPFCRVLDVVRVQGKHAELWNIPFNTLKAKLTNALTRVGPCNSFIYAGVR